ncbi:Aste57867_21242 [Aphanomyces stellatus]|uniref:Aste57867_21242 protein n=1 Tax=Aphanomyces stellatus TaxID=120398 RepID=A0A485LLN1_9STRA|nr:hypothetical protein As57867_021174 [Aphanomyces stellatus]VFT97914.1 Aste57867_21242 [Aphanomyces stellatus]
MGQSCDQNITNYKDLQLPYACAALYLPSFGSTYGTDIVKNPPNFAAIADYTSNSHSIYGYSICDFPTCLSSFKWLLANYPQSTLKNVVSYYDPLSRLVTARQTIKVATETGSNSITDNCVADLAGFGSFSTASLWYAAAQAVFAAPASTLATGFCASSACVQMTQAVQISLATCTVASGENLFAAAAAIVTFCAAHSPPYAVGSCDANVTAANVQVI